MVHLCVWVYVDLRMVMSCHTEGQKEHKMAAVLLVVTSARGPVLCAVTFVVNEYRSSVEAENGCGGCMVLLHISELQF